MYHQFLKAEEVPGFLGKSYQRYTTYPDWVTFNEALQNAGNATRGFWYSLYQKPYAHSDMNNNTLKIGKKFQEKLQEDITSHIDVGYLGQGFVVRIVPGAVRSNNHVYIFFPNKDGEINTELKTTFSI